MELHVVPIILGGGARLLHGVGLYLKLELLRVVQAPGVTYFTYLVVK